MAINVACRSGDAPGKTSACRIVPTLTLLTQEFIDPMNQALLITIPPTKYLPNRRIGGTNTSDFSCNNLGSSIPQWLTCPMTSLEVSTFINGFRDQEILSVGGGAN